MSQADSDWENSSAVADNLVSSYMRSLLGELRVVNAHMDCTRQAEGTYHYVYTLCAEVIKPNVEPKMKHCTLPVQKDSKHLTNNESLISRSDSVRKEKLEKENAKEVTFLLYENQKQRLQEVAEFEQTDCLKKVLRHFYSQLREHFKDSIMPPMALLVDGHKSNSLPLQPNMGSIKLCDLLPAGSNLTIVADNSVLTLKQN